MWLLLLMPCPLIGPFIFHGSGLPLSVSGSWSGSMCRAHIAFQEFQAVAMMLCRMAFCLSGNVVASHFDKSTVKAYLCNQGGAVSPLLSRLACQILSLTDKHSITLIPAYIPTYLNVEANYLSRGQLLPEGHLLPQMAQVAFCLWGLPELDLLASSHTTQCSMLVLLHPGNSTTSRGLGVECLQPSLDISGKLCLSTSYISSSSSVHVSGKTCQRSTHTSDSGGTILNGGSLVSHSSQHVGRHSSVLSHHKRFPYGCFSRACAQASVTSAFIVWLLRDVCCTDCSSLS